RTAHPFGVKRETEPALVLEPMTFDRVERQPRAARHAPGDLPEPVDPAGERSLRIDRGELLDGLVERPAGVEQRQVGFAARFPQRPGILGIELAANASD